VVVVAAGREERRLVAHALHLVEAEDVAVEAERAVDVRHLQVDVPDVDSGIDAHRAKIAPRERGVARMGRCQMIESRGGRSAPAP